MPKQYLVNFVTIQDVDDHFVENLTLQFPPDEDTQKWNLMKIQEFVRDRKNKFIVAAMDDAIVGIVFGWEIPRMEKSKQFYIDEVGVIESHRKKGVAKRMLHTLFARLKEEKFELVYVLTEKENIPANRLYLQASKKVSVENDIVMYTYVFD
jgi:ribosomal protein S18 acetylase RimI-like enzyme